MIFDSIQASAKSFFSDREHCEATNFKAASFCLHLLSIESVPFSRCVSHVRFEEKVIPSILEVLEGPIILPFESRAVSNTFSPLLWAICW